MTPASNTHARHQARIAELLARFARAGQVLTECSVETLDGVKVPDVAWASNAFLKVHHYETPFTEAPEICVEVTSPSNSRDEIQEKITLYLAKGAREVWVCDDKGNVTFNDSSGKLKKSKIATRFPSKI